MNASHTTVYITSLEEIIWGGILVAVTMALHGIGMITVLRANAYLKERFEQSTSFIVGMGILVLTSWMIMAVHLVEVFSWAGFFLWKGAVAAPEAATGANASTCYYFALMDYTTLGSNYNLHLRWRLLEGGIAMAGLLTFAWSTGVLLTLAGDFQDKQLLLAKRRWEKRHPKPAPSKPHHEGSSSEQGPNA